MRVIVIGIDPSLTGTAVAVRAPNGEIDVGRFASKPCGKRIEDRLARCYGLRAAVSRFIRDETEQVARSVGVPLPAVCFIEGYSYNSKGSVIATAEFGGLLREMLDGMCFAKGITEVSPATVKRFAVKGNASKTEVVAALTRRYGVEFSTDDEYDAYALARLGAVVEGLERPQNGNQLAAAEAVRKARA